MDAATHPGAGQIYTRLLMSRSEYERTGTDVRVNTALFKLSYGIRSTLALVAEGEIAHLSTDGDDDTGLQQTTIQLKYRLFKKDLGPLNTWRTSLFGGITIPGNVEGTYPENAYPRGSLVSTAILGRHGVNAELEYEEYGNQPDRVAVNGSHLYRLAPAEYTVDTRGAWYTMIESLNQFTDDGDSRSDVALGILYEARHWAWELSLRLPVDQDWPTEDDYTVTVGVRFLP